MKMKDILGFEVKDMANQTVEQLLQKKKELINKESELSQEIIKRKVEAKMGTLKNTALIRNLRKDIARIKTALTLIDNEIKRKKKEIKK